VKAGSHKVSTSLFVFAMCMATDAGRIHESGAGAWRIAPELAALGHPTSAPACSQPATARHSQGLFETLDPAAPDVELARMVSVGSREIVDFQWNPATGELSFSLANGAAGIPPARPDCGSH
jgi:hypothetical protein